MTAQLQVALIGVGRWGRSIARTIREEIPSMNLAWVVSNNPNVRDYIGSSCIVYDDWHKLLNVSSIHAVLLAVPPQSHSVIASAFMEHGLPVMLEKPVALSIKEAENLYIFAEKHGAIVRVNHIDLYNPSIAYIDKNIEKCTIKYITGRVGASYDSRFNIAPFWEYSPHFIAVTTRFGCGLPSAVSAKIVPSEIVNDLSKQTVGLRLEFDDLEAGYTGDWYWTIIE